MNDYLTKPVTLDVLKASLIQWVPVFQPPTSKLYASSYGVPSEIHDHDPNESIYHRRPIGPDELGALLNSPTGKGRRMFRSVFYIPATQLQIAFTAEVTLGKF